MGQPLASSGFRGGTVAVRGALLDFVNDPFYESEAEAVRYIADGLLLVREGKIEAAGSYADLAADLGDRPLIDHTDRLITPGFIDTHIHYPQTGMMAAYGEQLLEWLNRYTFPTERKFADADYARQVAELFLDELLKNGTTTALVFAAVFPASVNAFFEAAEARHLRMISGKVMMDCNAPHYLRDTAQSSYDDSKALIEKWHGRGRLLYAVTPRFAGTSTEAQLKLAAKLLDEFPDVYLHTHLSENVSEVAWIQELFPQYAGYLDVYDQTGLVRARSLFAHGVQLTDAEFQRLSEAKAAISFCPTSNLFLGSGLFRIEQAKNPEHPVKVGLGTDVGAGTSFSMLQTTNEAYKVAQLRGQKLSAFKALFLATLGGARALCLEDTLGSFDPGKEADFVVLDPQATPLLALRNQGGMPETLAALEDLLFSLVIMGSDRAVTATYILGEQTYPSKVDSL
ncbi:guanine deaminase [Nodosilinea sp. LEGE 06152]|uniref:guanine deaminase n=1 Tax=Nodosilinea sp. LEGE 06152 TaxID=2777966 RepID=UPI0018830954|nr:guanine deaminase [Nodosilinea sp. LEGE 06152]MBE9156018.1 guanine deaminase [Nodosilinea sp. LEGE 06152]